MGLFATCLCLWGNLPVRLANQRKSLRKFNLRLLATTCDSVWPRLKSSAVFKICDQRSVNVSYNPRSEVHCMQSLKPWPNGVGSKPWSRLKVGLKPWPNGVASRRKLKAWVYLWLRLARPCVYLRWLAMSCAHLRSLWSRSNLHASGCKFFTVWPPNPSHASWVTSINLLANEIQEMSALNCFFCDLRVLVRKFGRSFGHPTQVSTQVQLAYTCNYLPVRLCSLQSAVYLESPGILLWHFPGLESPGKRPLVLESSGNLLNSANKWTVWKAARRINIGLLGL